MAEMRVSSSPTGECQPWLHFVFHLLHLIFTYLGFSLKMDPSSFDVFIACVTQFAHCQVADFFITCLEQFWGSLYSTSTAVLVVSKKIAYTGIAGYTYFRSQIFYSSPGKALCIQGR